MMSW